MRQCKAGDGAAGKLLLCKLEDLSYKLVHTEEEEEGREGKRHRERF